MWHPSQTSILERIDIRSCRFSSRKLNFSPGFSMTMDLDLEGSWTFSQRFSSDHPAFVYSIGN
uniref:Uncharacterized protein n=1 Tax=Helianthus annuus TaxID=4232 RepID=A0A251TIK3_HELAN